jgi:hypothetical protein
MLLPEINVQSDKVTRSAEAIESHYDYLSTSIEPAPAGALDGGKWTVKPTSTRYTFRTDARVPKLG